MADEPSESAQAAAPVAKSPSAWPPLLAVMILMPAISWASTQFLILPKLRSTVAEQGTLAEASKGGHGAKAAPAKAEKGGHGAHGGKGESEKGGADASGKFSYDLENIVVNLSGAMGTRYLKTSFTLFSANPALKQIVDENKKQLLDVAITVLSSRSMADLESGGAKNVVRSDLQANFNQALSSDLVEQIYFSEFVVQ